MKDIIETIAKIKGLFSLTSVAIDEIRKAEATLNVVFADDFNKYLQKYGCISYDNHEFTGITEAKRLNVVDVTLFERKTLGKILSDKYVLEVLFDGDVVVAQDCSEKVYEISKTGVQREYSCFADYIESIV